MAQATVKTVQYLDPRIEPQPDPVYDYVIGPTQNQYYKIPASGLSNSNITFNNLTTLGIDRAYLDTFELELGVTITFTLDGNTNANELHPAPWEWTFDSFPFNKCCDEARVNINGGAFFSQPMSYVRAKERYMNQYELSKSYENVCPCHRAICQTESARNYCQNIDGNNQFNGIAPPGYYEKDNSLALLRGTYPSKGADFEHSFVNFGTAAPTRLGVGMFNYMQSSEGMVGGFNNSVVRRGSTLVTDAGNHVTGWEKYYKCDATGAASNTGNTVVVRVTWREPLFVSPFSSRYDATYGRPLYNITSMDFSFTMQNLGNMIRVVNFNHGATVAGNRAVQSYAINIDSAQLCYQVMTIPPILNKPLTTLVPYRRFVPYITDYHQSAVGDANTIIDSRGATITLTSGVYTFNEMPTAIWVFCGPNKADLQTNEQDKTGLQNADATKATERGNWDTNRLFGYIKKINISMANTTQILATAEPYDLYRIAKANGCEDSYWSWAGNDTVNPAFGSTYSFTPTSAATGCTGPSAMCFGAGSVLRLKPGVDLIVPDQPLIPGANANNMVFQCTAEFYVPPHSVNHSRYALWLLFEYVGVAAISPGQCEITMNPLGSGEIMAVSPVMSATSEATEGELEGSGFWDRVKRAAGIAGQLADDGIISMILKRIPGAQGASEWAKKHGFGEPSAKRSRGGATLGGSCVGGAVMGKGLNDWV